MYNTTIKYYDKSGGFVGDLGIISSDYVIPYPRSTHSKHEMWFQVGWCGGEGGVSSEHTKPDEQGSIRCLCPSSGLGLCPSLSRCPSLGICPSLGLGLGLKLGLGLGLGLGSSLSLSLKASSLNQLCI